MPQTWQLSIVPPAAGWIWNQRDVPKARMAKLLKLTHHEVQDDGKVALAIHRILAGSVPRPRAADTLCRGFLIDRHAQYIADMIGLDLPAYHWATDISFVFDLMMTDDFGTIGRIRTFKDGVWMKIPLSDGVSWVQGRAPSRSGLVGSGFGTEPDTAFQSIGHVVMEKRVLNVLPETARGALVGSPLDMLVRHPLIERGLKIVDVDDRSGVIDVHTDKTLDPVPLRGLRRDWHDRLTG